MVGPGVLPNLQLKLPKQNKGTLQSRFCKICSTSSHQSCTSSCDRPFCGAYITAMSKAMLPKLQRATSNLQFWNQTQTSFPLLKSVLKSLLNCYPLIHSSTPACPFCPAAMSRVNGPVSIHCVRAARLSCTPMIWIPRSSHGLRISIAFQLTPKP